MNDRLKTLAGVIALGFFGAAGGAAASSMDESTIPAALERRIADHNPVLDGVTLLIADPTSQVGAVEKLDEASFLLVVLQCVGAFFSRDFTNENIPEMDRITVALKLDLLAGENRLAAIPEIFQSNIINYELVV